MMANEPKKKKIPERRCIGCGETKPKPELIRVVRAPDGTVSVDLTGKKSGRGAYLCRKSTCLRRAVKTRQLSRNLDCVVPDELVESLALQIDGDNKSDGKSDGKSSVSSAAPVKPAAKQSAENTEQK